MRWDPSVKGPFPARRVTPRGFAAPWPRVGSSSPVNVAGRARPQGIGEGLRVKVNADVGSSKGRADPEEEVRKAPIAVQVGAPHCN